MVYCKIQLKVNTRFSLLHKLLVDIGVSLVRIKFHFHLHEINKKIS